MKLESWKDVKAEWLSDPAVRERYDASQPEFEMKKKLIEKRIQQGITQKELARLISTKQSAISRFESGNYNPTIGFLNKVANALGVKLKITVK